MDKSFRAYNRRRRTGTLIEVLCVALFTIIFLFPFLNQFAVSFSSGRAILSGEVFLWPIEFNTKAWSNVFNNSEMIRSLFFTIILTATVSVLQMVVITLAAYPMACRKMRFKVGFLVFFMIPMYFGGGLIPTYLLYKDIHLLNSPWVLVLPGLYNMFNMLILRTNFAAVPDALMESAKLDGANDFVIMTRIYVPLCVSTYATLTLFAAVSRWNGFTDAIFYMPNNYDYQPLQLVLNRTLNAVGDQEKLLEQMESGGAYQVVSESQKAANLLFTVVPIILVYPWLQKYFIKGVMVGAVKS